MCICPLCPCPMSPIPILCPCPFCVCIVSAALMQITGKSLNKREARYEIGFRSIPLHPSSYILIKRKENYVQHFPCQIFNVMKEDAIKAPTRLPNQYLLVQCSYGNIRRICEIFNDVVLVSLLLTLNIILVFPLMNLNKQIPAE